MESRFLLTVNVSNLRSIHIASIGGLAMVATVGIIAFAVPLALWLLISSAIAGALAAAIVIRMHREHVIGTPGDDLPMSLGLTASDNRRCEAKTTTGRTGTVCRAWPSASETAGCRSSQALTSAAPPSTTHWSISRVGFSSRGSASIRRWSVEGPDVCLQQIEDGLAIAARSAGVELDDVAVVGLDTPGPASATGVLSAKGSTNFVHPAWAGLDLPAALSAKARTAGHLSQRRQRRRVVGTRLDFFGADKGKTSISAIVGTGLGGGVIVNNQAIKGRRRLWRRAGPRAAPVRRPARA